MHKELVPTAAMGVIARGGNVLTVWNTKRRHFGFPGGKIEPGETGMDALIREMREEVGVHVHNFVNRIDMIGGDTKRLLSIYTIAEGMYDREPKPCEPLSPIAWVPPEWLMDDHHSYAANYREYFRKLAADPASVQMDLWTDAIRSVLR